MNEIATQLAEKKDLARLFYASGLFSDTKNEAAAFVKIVAGAELGLTPFIAMRDLYIISGKIALAAAQIAAKLKRSGFTWEVIKSDDDIATLRFKQAGKRLEPDISFSMDDARKLQLAERDNYKKQPATMLYWRAITKGARMFGPDVFNGPVYTPEELSSGEIVGELVPVESAATIVKTPDPIPTPSTAIQYPGPPAPIPPVTTMAQSTQHPHAADYPWLWKIECELNSCRGKSLYDLPTLTLTKMISDKARANKTTALDKVQIRQALDDPAGRIEAKQYATDQETAVGGLGRKVDFAEDQIPENYYEDGGKQ